MRICIATAIGRARTELAAFDHALVRMGAANFNLVRLSSVIPPGSEVVRTDRMPTTSPAGWGDRLYCVYADSRTSEPGVEVWAGVGWVQDERTGKGLFVEHEGSSETFVRDQISTSLADLQVSREIDLGPAHVVVTGARCSDRPTCALVMCTYTAEPWPAS